jgi:signal transduction histidine kinase/uncharacterized protein YhfF
VSSAAATDRRDLLSAVALETAGAVGDAFLIKLVESVGSVFGAGVCWVSELIDQRASARALACWPANALPAGEEYPLAGTPCQLIHERAVVAYAEHVAAAFPGDAFLAEHGIDGYMALPCKDSGGKVTGYLAVTTRRPLEPTGEEITALRIFASWVGEEIERRTQETRLRAREAELLESRARVVEAADAERQRIGRDLHDGVQQRLVALTQRVDIALRSLDKDDPERAAEILREAREQASGIGRELRELAHGLHPVGLTERGLEGALTVLAAQSELPLQIESLPDRRLPAPLELTLFYLVSEALTNAIKYARASAVTVRTTTGPASVHLEVGDDGIGGADAGSGSGLRGLADRIGALGGTLEVHSTPGEGTRLVADIPHAPFRNPRDPYLEFGYENDGGRGRQMIAQVVAGEKQCTICLAREWDLEGGPPRIGQRLKVCDHNGVQHATVVVTRTALMPMSMVDAETASAAAGEPMTIDEWRADRWRFYEDCRHEFAVVLGDPEWRLTEEEPMVVTYFSLGT